MNKDNPLKDFYEYDFLSVRSKNILKANNVNSKSDLEKFSNIQDLKELRNCGRKAAKEILDFKEIISNEAQFNKKKSISLKKQTTDNIDLHQKIKDIDLSIRSKNVLLRAKIYKIADLITLNNKDLLKLPNMGSKSLNEIQDFLKSMKLKLGSTFSFQENTADEEKFEDVFPFSDFKNIECSIDEIFFPRFLHRSLKNLDIFTIHDLLKYFFLRREKSSYSLLENELLKDLIDEIYHAKGFYNRFTRILDYVLIDTSNKRYRNVLSKRIYGILTLEAAAKQVKKPVTRERIRQLESKVLKGALKLTDILNREITKVYEATDEPIFLSTLELKNDFFVGISERLNRNTKPSLNKFLFDKNQNSLFQSELINNSLCIFPKKSMSYEETMEICLKDKAIENLESRVKNYSAPDKSDISTLARSLGRPDLSRIIFDKLNKDPASARGKTIKYMHEIFKNQTTSLTTQEIKKILFIDYELVTGENVIIDSIKLLGDIYQFEKRKWGKESYFRKLSDEEVIIFSKNIVKFLNEKNIKRFTANTLYKRLKRENIKEIKTKLDSLNEYDLDWVLTKISKKNKNLTDFARGRWLYGVSSDTNELKTINQLVIEFLEKEGRPQKIKEIKKFIETERGTSGFFQIHSNQNYPDLVEIDRKIWGLRMRDFNLSESEEFEIIKKIKDIFNSGENDIDEERFKLILMNLDVNQDLKPIRIAKVLRRHEANQKKHSKIFNINFRKTKKYSDSQTFIISKSKAFKNEI